MPCTATSQLTNSQTVPLPVQMPTTQSQWAVFVQQLQQLITAALNAGNRSPVNVVPTAYALYDSATLPALNITGATSALDSTNTQFGNASLKLTATAATVSVQFTGDPVTINAYQRWIASVYVLSSRTALAGTLSVVTASSAYNVDISGTLLSGTWGRLYGDCDLTADDNTSCTLKLTFTGCSAGDTFNLEAWQLEQASGTTDLPGPFVNSAVPGSQDGLPDGSTYVRLDGTHANNNVAYNYQGVWSGTTQYVVGDEVVYSGSYWLAIVKNKNSAPAQGNANWQVVGSYNNYQGAWSSTTTYYPGQEVTDGGNYWVCVALNLNSEPSATNANWVIAGPQNLDKVPDGTSRFAVTNGTGLNGVSAVDVNKKALIDFTQTGHVGKVLDNINDGTTRFAVTNGTGLNGVSAVDVNKKALIDFTQTGHTGKTVDNINDGVLYLRGVNYQGSSYDVPVDNATFQLALDSSGNIPGWSAASDLPPNSFYLGTSSPSPYIGSQYAVVRSYGSACRAISSRKFAVSRGDVVTVGGYGASLNGQTCYIQAIFYTSAGAIISAANASFTSSSWTASNGSATVPSTAAYMRLALYTASGSGYTYFAVNRVWCSTNDLRVSGSGATVGDQRNLLPTNWAGVRSVLSTSPISYTISGTTVSFSVAAFSVNGGGFTVAYNAASGSVTQAAGTTKTWFLYFRDAQAAGGSRTLYITSTPQDLAAHPDIVNIGNASVTVASGGGGTGGTGAGGGGWGGGNGTYIP